MPQGQRTASETREFKLMLTNINFLYLGLRVFIMCDRTYLGRFWTQFEAVCGTRPEPQLDPCVHLEC